MERMSSIFSEFPYDLIVVIAKQIDSFNDFIAFGGVCRLWRSAAIEANKFDLGPPNCSSWPWLMLADNWGSKAMAPDNWGAGAGDDVYCNREFYSLSKGMSFKVYLPETMNKRCFTSKGWLINIGKHGGEVSIDLLHPLSRAQIKLPHLTSSLKRYQPNELHAVEDAENDALSYTNFVHKVVLSSSSSSSAIIMVIYGSYSKLAFCNLGATVVEWIEIKTREAMYFDVIHYKGYFYAIDCQGRIVVCDVTGTNPTVANIVTNIPGGLLRRYIDSQGRIVVCDVTGTNPTVANIVANIPEGLRRSYVEKLYLVASMGKLLVISREGVEVRRPINEEGNGFVQVDIVDRDDDDDGAYGYGTTGFQIFEFDESSGVWTEVKNLGDRALFLGHNSSFSAESSSLNVEPNSIYFADDCTESYLDEDEGGGEDMGIYNLQDGSFRPHFNGKSCSPITPPMWIAL